MTTNRGQGGLDPSVTGPRAAFVVRDSTTDAAAVRVFRLKR